ncbi:MAG: rod shape-determining protein MreC [Caldisericaceae bacterium]
MAVIVVVTLLIFIAGIVGVGITPGVVYNYVVVKPLGNLMLSMKGFAGSVSSFFEMFRQNKQLLEENATLKDQIDTLNERIKLLQSYYYDNQNLTNELGIVSKSHLKFTESQVLWFSASSNTITLDKGQADGVKKNMPVVVSPDGSIIELVGVVSEVSSHSSTVMLACNVLFNVTVKNAIRGGFEIAQGNGGELVIESYNPQAVVNLKDIYVTSGYGDIYPSGIVVGEVDSVSSSNSVKRVITLKPGVDFSTLLRVMVITGNG